jgi:formylglycine-generating enzyme required for sulfatase activity
MNEPLNDFTYLDMVEIPAGKFLMGSAPEEEGRFSDEGPQHEVSLSAFLLSRTPITQAQWRAVASFPRVNQYLDPDPSFFKGDDRPVEQVSWLEAMEFCARLSQHSGRNYILPSESQWEYACRAGTTTRFSTGDTITTDQANFDGTYVPVDSDQEVGDYRGETTPVGMFPANAWGMQDMHGNVWEWCLDHWHQSYEGAPTDGSAWVEDDSLGKSCAAAAGHLCTGNAARPTNACSPDMIEHASSVSASVAEASLGKSSEGAAGSTNPAPAAAVDASVSPRTAANTALASASAAAEDDSQKKSSGVGRGTTSSSGTAARLTATGSPRLTAATTLVSASAAEGNILGKSCAAALGATSSPVSAARLTAPGTPRTTAVTTVDSASAAEDDSLGKSSEGEPGSSNHGTAAPPAGTETARLTSTATLASASVAEASLGKSSEGARGTSTPGSAARLSATGAPRTTATASSASAFVAEDDSQKKSCAVAPGSSFPASAARPTGAAATRPAASTTLASASASSLKLLRGGAWFNRPPRCRSAFRNSDPPSCCDDGVGFRVCCLYETVLP